MRYIPVVKSDNPAIVDDADYEVLSKNRWYSDPFGYVFRMEKVGGKSKRISLHAQIMGTPKGMVTDHINHNPRDNRRENLRIVSSRENSQNTIRSYLLKHPEEKERISKKKPAILDYTRMVKEYNAKHPDSRIFKATLAREMYKAGIFKSTRGALNHIRMNDKGTAKKIWFNVLSFLKDRLDISFEEMRSGIEIKESTK